MAGALGAPGSGRLAAADAVVRADPTITIGSGEDGPGPALPRLDDRGDRTVVRVDDLEVPGLEPGRDGGRLQLPGNPLRPSRSSPA